MKQRTRMFKALAALALSMTAAAALLAWLEPARSPSVLSHSLETLQAFVRSAVTAADRLTPAAWQGVEIVVADSAGPWRTRALTAVLPDSGHHFRVQASGDVEPTAAWREQQFEPAGGAIRVLVEAANGDGALPDPQWISLRTLLLELQTRAGQSERSSPAAWPVTLPDDGGAAISELRTLLNHEGIPG